MRKSKLFGFVFVYIAFIVCGCSRFDSPAPEKSASHFVTRIDITCEEAQTIFLRHYTTTEKIEPILIYLRLLEPRGKPETDPERLTGYMYKIVVHLSDGQRHVYYQKADRYLSKDSRPWERINQKQAEKLYPLLQQMPSDTM